MTNIDGWDRTHQTDSAQHLHPHALDDKQLMHIFFFHEAICQHNALIKT